VESETESSYFMQEKKLNFNNESSDSYINHPLYMKAICKSIGQSTFVKISPQKNLDLVINTANRSKEEKKDYLSPNLMLIDELAVSAYNNPGKSSKFDALGGLRTVDFDIQSEDYDSRFKDDGCTSLTKFASIDKKFYNRPQTVASSAYSSNYYLY
jgi:hypothetical protein